MTPEEQQQWRYFVTRISNENVQTITVSKQVRAIILRVDREMATNGLYLPQKNNVDTQNEST